MEAQEGVLLGVRACSLQVLLLNEIPDSLKSRLHEETVREGGAYAIRWALCGRVYDAKRLGEEIFLPLIVTADFLPHWCGWAQVDGRSAFFALFLASAIIRRWESSMSANPDASVFPHVQSQVITKTIASSERQGELHRASKLDSDTRTHARPPARPPIRPSAHSFICPSAHPPIRPFAHPPIRASAHPRIRAPAHPRNRAPARPRARARAHKHTHSQASVSLRNAADSVA